MIATQQKYTPTRKEELYIKQSRGLKITAITLIVFAVLSPLTSIGYMQLYSVPTGLYLLIANIVIFVTIIATAIIVLLTNNKKGKTTKAHKVILVASSFITCVWEMVRFLLGIGIVIMVQDSNSVASQKVSTTTGTTSRDSGVDTSKINSSSVYIVIIVYLIDIMMIVGGLILIVQMGSRYRALYWNIPNKRDFPHPKIEPVD